MKGRGRLRKLEKQQSDVETIRGDSEDSSADRKIKRIRSDSDSSFEESSELSSVDSNFSKEDSSDSEPIIQNIGNKRGRPRKTHRKTNSSQITQKTKPRLGRRKLDPNDAKATDNAGQTNLHIACMRNNINKVRTLIEKGANINATDNSEWTPLHEAAYGGYYKIVVLLLEHGAKVNVVDKEGDTPLHDACYQGHVDIIQILLEYGADVEKTNDKNERPEDVINRPSVESVDQKEQIIKLLNTPIHTEKKPKKVGRIEPTVTVVIERSKYRTLPSRSETVSRRGRPRIHREEIHTVPVPRRTSARNTTRSLAFNNEVLRIDPRAVDKTTGRTQLHHMAKRNKTQNVGHLLEEGAHVNAQDLNGRTALHDAASEGHLEVVSILLAYGADPDIKEKHKHNTALHEGARKGHKKIVELLLESANPKSKNAEQKTALEVAKTAEIKNTLRRAIREDENSCMDLDFDDDDDDEVDEDDEEEDDDDENTDSPELSPTVTPSPIPPSPMTPSPVTPLSGMQFPELSLPSNTMNHKSMSYPELRSPISPTLPVQPIGMRSPSIQSPIMLSPSIQSSESQSSPNTPIDIQADSDADDLSSLHLDHKRWNNPNGCLPLHTIRLYTDSSDILQLACSTSSSYPKEKASPFVLDFQIERYLEMTPGSLVSSCRGLTYRTVSDTEKVKLFSTVRSSLYDELMVGWNFEKKTKRHLKRILLDGPEFGFDNQRRDFLARVVHFVKLEDVMALILRDFKYFDIHQIAQISIDICNTHDIIAQSI